MNYNLTATTFGSEETAAMHAVIESGMFTMGEHVKEFEQAFAAYFGMKHAVMVNSGSSANLVGVASLFFRKEDPLRRGDEVIVPCISWATTFYPLHQYGLKLKFVDVDLETLNCDTAELEKAITPKTRMVVAVSILGNPCQFDAIAALCKKHNLILFEDNCESMGAKFNGRFTGTFGLVNTFSTFFSHHISTMEGGLVLTDDYEVYCLCKSLRNHGWTRDQEPDSPVYQRKADDFFEAYRFILPGYNVRPGELHGALGKEQLKKLDRFLDARRRNARHFTGLFANNPRYLIQRETGESAWFSFTVIVQPESGIPRARVLAKLKDAGIEHRIITGGNFLRHDVVKHMDYEVTRRANADIAHDYGFFVGNHPADLRREIDRLHSVLASV